MARDVRAPTVFPSVTIAGLTPGRVVYADTGGLLADSPSFTFSGGVLNLATTSVTAGSYTSTGAAAGYRFNARDASIDFQWYATGAIAWLVNVNTAAYVLAVDNGGNCYYAGMFTDQNNKLIAVNTMAAGNAADICTITTVVGAGQCELTVSCDFSGWSQDNKYDIPLTYDGTANTWQRVHPVFTTGPYSGNDFDVDVRTSGAVTTLRLRRVSGSAAGQFSCSIRSSGYKSAHVIAGSATTYAGATISGTYHAATQTLTPFKTVTAVAGGTTYTALASEETFIIDATLGNVTINLPALLGLDGKRYSFIRVDSSTTYTVTVDASGSETINGALTYIVADKNEVFEIFGTATQWTILADRAGAVPIGGIIPFDKSLTGVPAMPSGYVECNGQTISDPNSPLNTRTIRDLNGSGGQKRFIRGSATSGTAGGADSHTHTISTTSLSTVAGASTVSTASQTGSTSNVPAHIEMVMIMRVR